MPNAPRTFRNKAQQRARIDRREAAHKRGYDHTWANLRNAYLAQHPLCEHCEQRGRVEPAREVDHIKPFNGRDDPLRLDWKNLQSLCHPCHVAKTHKEKREGR